MAITEYFVRYLQRRDQLSAEDIDRLRATPTTHESFGPGEIIVPQVRGTLMVGLILSFVTMMSVLSVPLMINAQSPTMITADIAFRINAYGDYGVANALGVISLLLTSSVAWLYMRQAVKERM